MRVVRPAEETVSGRVMWAELPPSPFIVFIVLVLFSLPHLQRSESLQTFLAATPLYLKAQTSLASTEVMSSTTCLVILYGGKISEVFNSVIL